MKNAGAVAPPYVPREPPPEPAIIAYVTEDTQAEMLEEAATEGAPFCEI